MGNRLYLVAVKDNKITDVKWIYYNYQGEMGFSYYKLFAINFNNIITINDYEFTDTPIKKFPKEKFQVNNEGIFVRYYDKNGKFKNLNDNGYVENNKRQGKWTEIKKNSVLEENPANSQWNDYYTYMEATYNQGIPLGELKFYKLIQKYNKNGLPIISSRKKGKLIYTEVYENGKMIKRIF